MLAPYRGQFRPCLLRPRRRLLLRLLHWGGRKLRRVVWLTVMYRQNLAVRRREHFMQIMPAGGADQP